MLERPLFLEYPNLSGVLEGRNHTHEVPTWLQQFAIPYPQQVRRRHVGVEIEVEDCTHLACSPMGWEMDRDGSLRGEYALEYKTLFPCSLETAWGRLQGWKAMVDNVRAQYKKAFNFSERTSIHVHVDVRDLRLSQIKNIVKLYLIFERSFFDKVGRHRRHNIFCVPVSESVATQRYFIRAENWMRKWEKYAALNIAPVRHFGTVEFRAMAGTDNIHLILQWMLLCTSLVEFAKHTHDADIAEIISSIKSESQYERLAQRIFGPVLAGALTFFPDEMDQAASVAKMIN